MTGRGTPCRLWADGHFLVIWLCEPCHKPASDRMMLVPVDSASGELLELISEHAA